MSKIPTPEYLNIAEEKIAKKVGQIDSDTE